jgi:4'-phosphopantetheinyl transferase EntD
LLARLLSDRVTVAEGPVADFGPPSPDDDRWVARAVDRRRREFAAGRGLARQALAALGVALDDCGLVPDQDGVPGWPAGVVGSITHAGGWCAAAVARAAAVRSLGIDGEDLARVDGQPDWLRLVLRPAERDALAGLDPDEVGRRALILFSAKESFYKCQFPLTRTRLDFLDAEVVVRPEEGAFDVECAVPLPAGLPRRWSGRYEVADDLVLTAVELAAER